MSGVQDPPRVDLIGPRAEQSQRPPVIGRCVFRVEPLQDEGVECQEAASRLALGQEVLHGELGHLK